MNLVSRVCLYVRHEVECLRHVVHPSSKLGSYCFVLFMIVSCAIISILLIVFSFRSATDEVLAVRPGRDALSYAIVVDAGSSGSRGHLYKWPPHSGNPHHLLDLQPVTDIRGNAMLKTVTPGLSSLASRPEAALEYFRPILDFATAHIPLGKQKNTPIYVLATAGMRLLNYTAGDSQFLDCWNHGELQLHCRPEQCSGDFWQRGGGFSVDCCQLRPQQVPAACRRQSRDSC